MPERWERELRRLGGLDVEEAPIRERVDRGSSGDRMPPRRDRFVAGAVAGVVAIGAIAVLWRTLPGDGPEPIPPGPASGPGDVATGVVSIDIRRSSEHTGDPEAIARFGTQEQWMCPDGWNLVNPDGSTEGIVFDCGQEELFEAPPGTPIEVTGDFETVDASAAWREPGAIGPSTDRVADAEPGTVVTYAYEVTWADGSEASFWLLLTVEGDPEEPSATRPEFVIRYHGIGERSTEEPTVTVTYRGETLRGCTQAFEWTLPDGTTRDEDDETGCSFDPLFRVPPGTPIVMIADTALDIVRSRTTTPFYGGPNAVGASVRWPEGHAEFLVPFEVDATGFTPPEIELVCAADDRLPFTHPGGGVILPGGSSFITGNLVGFQPLDVVEQMTRKPNGQTEWSGTWQAVRDGEVVATVDWDSLSGTACRGSGIGGV